MVAVNPARAKQVAMTILDVLGQLRISPSDSIQALAHAFTVMCLSVLEQGTPGHPDYQEANRQTFLAMLDRARGFISGEKPLMMTIPLKEIHE